MSEWKKYKRKGYTEMRPYIKGEDLTGISVAAVDDPNVDMGMVARNPKNHLDQWYMARKYFNENMEKVDSKRHQCPEWDYLEICEDDPEFEACLCFREGEED